MRQRRPVIGIPTQTLPVRRLGEGLRVTATAPDGLIEAIESPNGHYMIAVQWHPEVFESTDPHVYNLLRDFIKAAAWLHG